MPQTHPNPPKSHSKAKPVVLAAQQFQSGPVRIPPNWYVGNMVVLDPPEPVRPTVKRK
jgi:hypothetical protein